MATTLILFHDKPDGTLEIEAQHEGEFNLGIKSHAALHAVMQTLPAIFEPATAPEAEQLTRLKHMETGQIVELPDDGSEFLKNVSDPEKWMGGTTVTTTETPAVESAIPVPTDASISAEEAAPSTLSDEAGVEPEGASANATAEYPASDESTNITGS